MVENCNDIIPQANSYNIFFIKESTFSFFYLSFVSFSNFMKIEKKTQRCSKIPYYNKFLFLHSTRIIPKKEIVSIKNNY